MRLGGVESPTSRLSAVQTTAQNPASGRLTPQTPLPTYQTPAGNSRTFGRAGTETGTWNTRAGRSRASECCRAADFGAWATDICARTSCRAIARRRGLPSRGSPSIVDAGMPGFFACAERRYASYPATTRASKLVRQERDSAANTSRARRDRGCDSCSECLLGLKVPFSRSYRSSADRSARADPRRFRSAGTLQEEIWSDGESRCVRPQ
jgi:hypothetical protein